jgi:hypothetical protein
MMERICDKLTRIGVAHLTSTKQCAIRNYLLLGLRPLIDFNEALELEYCNLCYLISHEGFIFV